MRQAKKLKNYCLMNDSHTIKMHVFTPYFKVARKGDMVGAKCTWDGTRTNKTTKIGNLNSLLFTLVMITSITYLQDIGLVMKCANFSLCITPIRTWIPS